MNLGDSHPLQRHIKLFLCSIYLKIEQNLFLSVLVDMSRENWSAEVAVGSAHGSDSVICLGPYMGLSRGLKVLEAGLGRSNTGEKMLKVCG